MAPPKVRFLTKIYHPNIGVFVFSHTFSNLVNSHSLRQTRADMSGYLERSVCDSSKTVENGVFIVLCRQMVACPADQNRSVVYTSPA